MTVYLRNIILLLLPFSCFAAEQGVDLDIRWMGTDLIDEMVHSWEMEPPFADPTLTALVEIDGPVGLDDRFSVTVENQLFDRVSASASSHIRFAHCSACRKWVVKSSKSGTYFGRGINQPELLKDLSSASGAKYGLSLSFEAEGRDLVLRSQLFSMTEIGQPIVWAHTYSTSSTARLALQNDQHLMTLKEARLTQDTMIHRVDPLQFVSRMTFRMYTVSDSNMSNSNLSGMSPILFAEQSIEGVLLPKKNRRMAFTVGATSIEKTMAGYSVGGHLAQLLFKTEPSLSNPDLYLVGGFNFVRVRGPGVVPFSTEQLDIAKIKGDRSEPRASFVSFRLGLELLAKNRFGLLAFIENTPTFDKSKIIAKDSLLGIPYHCMGLGMVVQW